MLVVYGSCPSCKHFKQPIRRQETHNLDQMAELRATHSMKMPLRAFHMNYGAFSPGPSQPASLLFQTPSKQFGTWTFFTASQFKDSLRFASQHMALHRPRTPTHPASFALPCLIRTALEAAL